MQINSNQPFLIGSKNNCDFVFSDDKQLNPYHAKLSYKNNILTLSDLDSEKGTWIRLSEKKIKSEKYILSFDSEIRMYPYAFVAKIK